VLVYLRLVEKYLLKPDVAFEAAYKKSVLNQLGKVENNDIFTLSFIAWLIARWEKKTAYKVVLTLVQDDNYMQ
jgi:hypothetical protein